MPWRQIAFEWWHAIIEVCKEIVTGAIAIGAAWGMGYGYWKKIMEPRRQKAKAIQEMLEIVKRIAEDQQIMKGQLAQNGGIVLAMIEADPGHAVYTDPAGEIMAVTAGYTRLTGLDANSAKRGGWKRAIVPDDLRRVEEEWEEAKAAKGIFVSEFRFRHIMPQLGGSTPVICTSSPRFIDGLFYGWASRIELLSDPLMPVAAPIRGHDDIAKGSNDDDSE